jgi:hypothetical protein
LQAPPRVVRSESVRVSRKRNRILPLLEERAGVRTSVSTDFTSNQK